MGEMFGSDSCSDDDEVSEEDVVAEESPLQKCLLAAEILLGRAAADNIFADNEWQVAGLSLREAEGGEKSEVYLDGGPTSSRAQKRRKSQKPKHPALQATQ